MTTTDLTGAVSLVLDELGATPDAVADQLRSRAIKGSQGITCACPIALLISGLPGIDSAEVLDEHVKIWPVGEDGTYDVTLPEPVAAFVWGFDQGIYLDLVDLPAVA
jgi:hypothetical protein